MYQITPLHYSDANQESLSVFITTYDYVVTMEAFTFLWKVLLFFPNNNGWGAVSCRVIPLYFFNAGFLRWASLVLTGICCL